MALPRTPSSPTMRWRKAYNRAAVRRRPSRPEWRDLGQRMVGFLQTFDENMEEEDLSEQSQFRDKLVDMFREDRTFIKQFLLMCLEKKRGQLSTYLDIVEEAFIDRRESPLLLTDGGQKFWEELFESLYERSVDLEDTKALREALSVAHDRQKPKIRKPWLNSNALVNACLKDLIKLVKLFLGKGYRLKSIHFDKKRQETNWRDLPFRVYQEPKCVQDEVQNLHILRAMSKPCYLLSCYYVVSNAKRFSNFADSCSCCSSSGTTPLNTYMRNMIEVEFHYCPYHLKYAPIANCSEHAPCNDPIFRSFEVSEVADRCSKWIPEYREEYKEIAKACNRLASELLEQCKDTKEVEALLEDKTGSTKYFRKEFVRKMKYPRLNMAIQNNHKAFVGHMFCQQILRSQWHGKVPWHDTSTRFKVIYVLVQLLMTPWNIFHFLFRQTLRDLKVDEKKWKSLQLSGTVYDYLSGPCNLDEPLNKFITFTWTYWLFWFLIMLCVCIPMARPEELVNNFHWYHNLLGVFTIGMVVNDVSIIFSVRSFSLHLKFWRVYDIILHLILVAAFLARSLMGKINPCFEECDAETIEKRIPYDTVSNCFFSMAAVMGGLRFLYWFQLHDKIGPIVINLSRVVVDLVTFAAIYSVLLLSFVSAMIPLKATNSRCENLNITTSRALAEGQCWDQWSAHLWWEIFQEMGSLLFWSILNPEKPENFESEKPDGIFALVIVGLYDLMTVVVLLNLLIAVMNATIQKVSDRQHMYWKFVRTSIWIDFFGQDNILPVPFNVIVVIRSFLMVLVRKTRKALCAKSSAEAIDVTARASNDDSNSNAYDERKKKAKDQNTLLMSLLERYWHSKKPPGTDDELNPGKRQETSSSESRNNNNIMSSLDLE